MPDFPLLTHLPLIIIGYMSAVLLAAYIVRGIAGFGSGLVAIPLLVLVLPVPIVVPAVGLLDYLGSITHGITQRRQVVWRELLVLLPFTLLGVGTALYLFQSINASGLVHGLGSFILLFAIWSLLPIRLPTGSRRWAVPAGFFAGLVGSLFGTGGPFYVIYFRLRGLDPGAFRATVGTLFMLDGALRIIGYLGVGMYQPDVLGLAAASIPLFILGIYLGGRIHSGLRPEQFTRFISLILLVSGTLLLLK